MFRLEMLPASNGDCLWLEYGDASTVRRVLIDTGWARTYPDLRRRILALPRAERVFELLIITHIDADHIQGAVPLLQDDALGCTFKDIWYNGWRHIENIADIPVEPIDVLGAREGEFIGVLLEDRGLPWNTHPHFGGDRIVVPDAGDLPVIELDGGLRLTLLSPTRARLIDLVKTWRADAKRAGFEPGDKDAIRAQLASGRYASVELDPLGDPIEQHRPVDELDVLGEIEGPAGHDNSEPNGSSIAVLVEFDGTRALLTGDAWPAVMVDSLQRLGASQADPLQVDAWKLAHHGSWANVSAELVQLIKTPRVLVSTNGDGFQHPHPAAIDLVVANRRHRGRLNLVFNYRTTTTEPWADADRPRNDGGYRATYPAGVSMLL
jgi:hypothetical protein